jgi:hypothetical protein
VLIKFCVENQRNTDGTPQLNLFDSTFMIYKNAQNNMDYIVRSEAEDATNSAAEVLFGGSKYLIVRRLAASSSSWILGK